jgi:aldose 1-epimerase
VAIENWGRTQAGDTVQRIVISDGGLTASIISWGAAVQDLRLAGHGAPLVLGFNRFEDYEAHSPYFGATAGRAANRIGGARFEIDGKAYETEPNFLGRHTLHGGKQGTGKRNWTITDAGPNRVRLEILDPDGQGGFPGNLKITNEYSIEDGTLRIVIQAGTDAPTLCNVAHHSYFNLEDGGATDCLSHRMQIAADTITELDAEQIPTGALALVGGTPFDFRQMSPIGRITGEAPFIHDHNYCLSAGRTALREVVHAQAPRSGVRLAMLTTEPGVQLYTGNKLAGRPADGLHGAPYGAFAGFCLEAQCWPDAPNHRHFPNIVLRPGDSYRQETVYRFSRG